MQIVDPGGLLPQDRRQSQAHSPKPSQPMEQVAYRLHQPWHGKPTPVPPVTNTVWIRLATMYAIPHGSAPPVPM